MYIHLRPEASADRLTSDSLQGDTITTLLRESVLKAIDQYCSTTCTHQRQCLRDVLVASKLHDGDKADRIRIYFNLRWFLCPHCPLQGARINLDSHRNTALITQPNLGGAAY